jgi:glycosyltransferase involved in cell wall biosynthesis
MSRIAIDARELRTSTGRYVERLLHYLQQIDTHNDYTVLLKPHDMEVWQPTNHRFAPVACPHDEFTFDEQLGFKKQLHRLKPDLVHFAMAQQPVSYHGKVVTTLHDLTTLRFDNPDKNKIVFKFKQFVYAYVVKRVAAKSQALITPSQYVREDVSRFTGVDDDKITVTLESADAITVHGEPVSGLGGKQFLMYVGRPTPHKNLNRLIEAFAALKARHPDLVLVLAGKYDRNYQRAAARVKQQSLDNVVFTDFVSEGQLRWLYENCAAYVFPSLSEGFGLPGLEAMIHGAPVVSSNATCLPEVYGDAAHYFDPLDVQSMADAINEVLTDKNLRQSLIAKGSEQVKKYSWGRMAEQTLEVYARALS